MKTWNLLGIFLATLASAQTRPVLPETPITFRVVDESGAALPGTPVTVNFEDHSANGTTVRGATDRNGLYRASAPSSRTVRYQATRPGYYTTGYHYIFTAMTNGHWVPHHPTQDIVLRPIGRPAPMFAKRVLAPIPRADEPVGYDLAVGDWVTPDGRGLHADFTITITRQIESFKVFDLNAVLKFPGEGNGVLPLSTNSVVRSVLRLSSTAPDHGYQDVWNVGLARTMKAYKTSQDLERNFYFRIRSTVVDGKIVQAQYGKIHGDIEVDGVTAKSFVKFTYYLNPDGTRNVEFDPQKNLFGQKPALDPPWEP